MAAVKPQHVMDLENMTRLTAVCLSEKDEEWEIKEPKKWSAVSDLDGKTFSFEFANGRGEVDNATLTEIMDLIDDEDTIEDLKCELVKKNRQLAQLDTIQKEVKELKKEVVKRRKTDPVV